MQTKLSSMALNQSRSDEELHLYFKGFTFAVGIWTAIDGVGRRPGAEGCMAEGCIGLKAPWENIGKTQHKIFVITYVGNVIKLLLCARKYLNFVLTASVKPDCWLACSSCFWRGIPAPGMYPA